MNKADRIHKLLEDNKEILLNGAEHNGLCYDGLVNEEEYDKQKVKLAFLLKETNGNDKDGKLPTKLNDWEYADWLRNNQVAGKEPLYRTFYNVCMWISEFYDILKDGTTDVEKYLKNGALQITDELRESLNKVAVVNLKKTWGRGTSSWNDINGYISNPEIKKVLNQEMEMLSPDVVLCGGREVFDLAIEVFGDGNLKPEVLTTQMGNKIDFIKNEGATYIHFRHPSSRKSRADQFEYAQDVFLALKDIL